MMKQPVGSLKPYQRSLSAVKSSQKKSVQQLRKEAVELYALKVRELNAHKMQRSKRNVGIRQHHHNNQQQSPINSRERTNNMLNQSTISSNADIRGSPIGRPTSYNLLQQNKHRYAASEMGTRRSLNNPTITQQSRRVPVIQTSRERLSTSNSNSRSPLRSIQSRPANRHANSSVCSQMFATMHQKKESAKKLLHAVELSEKNSKKSVNSLRNKSFNQSFGGGNRNSQTQFGGTSQEMNNLLTAHSTNAGQSRQTLTKRFSSRCSASSVSRPLRLRQVGLEQRASKEHVHRQGAQAQNRLGRSAGQPKRCLTSSKINGKSGGLYASLRCNRNAGSKPQLEQSLWQHDGPAEDSQSQLPAEARPERDSSQDYIYEVQQQDVTLDPPQQTYFSVKAPQRSPSMGELMEINEIEPGQNRIMFEPSDFYVHEVLRFKVKHASMRDKVQTFNEASQFWERDNFLSSCHPKTHLNDKSREGRKLRIAEYHKRMQHKPFKPPKRHIIPSYVGPHEKKRETVRYNIRMKMYLASGIEFESPLDAQARRRQPTRNEKLANKVTDQNAAQLNKFIALNADVNNLTTL